MLCTMSDFCAVSITDSFALAVPKASTTTGNFTSDTVYAVTGVAIDFFCCCSVSTGRYKYINKPLAKISAIKIGENEIPLGMEKPFYLLNFECMFSTTKVVIWPDITLNCCTYLARFTLSYTFYSIKLLN